MIKENELRIGNWVSFDLHPKQIIDFEILEYASRNAKPIPLTPEILEKCGFKKDKDERFNGIIESYTLEIDVKGDNKNTINYNLPAKTNIKDKKLYNFGNYTVNDYWASNNFKYLHELQNLYFALTGNELEIKLPAEQNS